MMTKPFAKILSYGDHALLVQWDADGFSESVNDTIHELVDILRLSGRYIEVVPGYDSFVCVIDLGVWSLPSAKTHVEEILNQHKFGESKTGNLVEIPVNYGGEYGPDIETICAASKLSIDEVITQHSQHKYRVCMMGFIPGFTFLSPAPTPLHHPRLETPRIKVPAGSIGIANWQTGIYGLESPGGWQIIGRTPLSIFDANRTAPFLLKAGDRVRFIPQ